jgi:uncharacterized protein (TIGR03084 family)
VTIDSTDIFEALEAEQECLEEILTNLRHADWDHASRCSGWSVADVVLHLAQTEEAAVAVLDGQPHKVDHMLGVGSTDEVMERWVGAERGGSPGEILDRWANARRQALSALRSVDPARAIRWAVAPLKPSTLATTRLAEHWAHALDITEPLGIPYPDTDRLSHIAWLAHRTLPYAFAVSRNADAPTVRIELTAPQDGTWIFGPQQADATITGPASQFCRVATRRLEPARADALRVVGSRGRQVLEVVRTYA